MTPEEAKTILEKSSIYFDPDTDSAYACIDGWCSIAEVEAMFRFITGFALALAFLLVLIRAILWDWLCGRWAALWQWVDNGGWCL
jgi:hypothetical protein